MILKDAYGPTGAWCWLDVFSAEVEKQKFVHKLVLLYYCITWFFIILNGFFVFKVISILRVNQNNSNNKYLLSVYNRLKWFPICQILCMVPSTVSRIYNIFDFEPNFVLCIFQCIFGSIIGVFYLLIYIRLPNVKNSLNVFFAKLCKKRVNIEPSDASIYNEQNLLSDSDQINKKIVILI